jgi:molybdopterin/thiamine biosynthesis adenylyltransferase
MQMVLPELSELEHELYERQIQIDGFGTEGQRRLKAASVMISRVGGLGGTVAMLLARAGVGRLVLAHDGLVELENLNRMPLAFREHLGQPRIDVFRETLLRINPELDIIIVGESVNAANVAALVAQAEVVVDGAPLFEERYLMNREAVRQRRPLVMAAQFGLESYITTILPGQTPCLACIYPEPPDEWNLKCFPVIAPSSMLVATMAAMEAIKLLTERGETLANTLLYCDLSTTRFRRLRINRNPACAVCGDTQA